MSDPVIDLNIKFVPDNVAIWRIYPGTKKDFVKQFIKDECVFLELPGLDLEKGDLRGRAKIDPKIAKSKALAEWYLSNPKDRKSQPSSNVADYIDNYNKRSVGSSYSNFERLFKKAKVGDIVVVPEESGFQSKLYIGEIVSEYSVDDSIAVRQFGIHKVPFRKVKWLRVDFEKRHVPADLSYQLRGRRTVRSVSVDDYGLYIFRQAYQNFVFKEQGQMLFEGPAYDNDPETAIPGIIVLQYALAAANAKVLGYEREISLRSFDQLRKSSYRRHDVLSFEMSFASPGSYRVWHGSVRALLLALALVAVAGTDLSASEAQKAVVQNDQSQSLSAHVIKVREDYKDLMESITPKEFERLKEERKKAENGVGFKERTKVKK